MFGVDPLASSSRSRQQKILVCQNMHWEAMKVGRYACPLHNGPHNSSGSPNGWNRTPLSPKYSNWSALSSCCKSWESSSALEYASSYIHRQVHMYIRKQLTHHTVSTLHMYMCSYIRWRTCVRYMYIYTYDSVSTWVLSTYVVMYTCRYVNTNLLTCVHTNWDTSIHKRICTCIRTYSYTCIRTGIST